ncbi:MAG: competence/damage-inducible protein A [Isosphaeraceae bacterium]|nr:competence/damage-inducible protein A [Isosphaeraceae bacterium]
MIAELIAVGTEIVSGQALDTNSRRLAEELGRLGIRVKYHTSIGDDLEDNVDAFGTASRRVDLVVVTGGLGPTQDDLTRQVLANVAGVGLVHHEPSLEAIRALFARRNRVMTDRNRVQALFPEGAEPLPNRIGTAPGIWMRIARAWFAALPGVPYEMEAMFAEQVAPRLRAEGLATRVIVHRKINLFGKGEAEVESLALDLTARGRKPEVGITVSDATISFRVAGEGADEAEALASISETLDTIRSRFADIYVGEGDVDIADAAAASLIAQGKTLATAESCTGGMIASRLTSIPGISAAYLGGLVTYSNDAKSRLVDVPAELIETRGAVSPETAAAMAEGVRDRFGADYGLAVTGIAGPGGGTPEKPVGLVYIGLAGPRGTSTSNLELGPEQPRDVIQRRTTKHALNRLRLELAAGS